MIICTTQWGGGGAGATWYQLYLDACVKSEGHLSEMSEMSERTSPKMGINLAAKSTRGS